VPEETPTTARDSVLATLTKGLVLCMVCALVVSTAAVGLRPQYEANKALDRKRNILLAAGLLEEGGDVEFLFDQVEPRLVDLATGEYVENVDPSGYDRRAARKDPQRSIAIPAEQDLARLRRRARYSNVYVVYDNARLRSVILPIYGAGLYSTLYGYIALAGDGNTVQGVRFYEHRETPGLGGRVDDPAWLAKWKGKQVCDQDGKARFALVKGSVDPEHPESRYRVDALSGATMTSRGVTNLVQYWLGDGGFGPFLARIRTQGG